MRRLTASGRLLPDFLIIGAQRCGTSSLYKYLGSHPQVVPSLRKEVEFFSTRFAEGENWYRAHFPLRARRLVYERLSRRKLLSFEATPDYLLDPRAPARAAEMLPDARVIALFRNPTDRAFSHYLHNRRLGAEQLSFEEALDEEEERIGGEIERLMLDPAYPARPLRRLSYVTRGLYANQVSRWLEVFPGRQVLLLRFEDLVGDPQGTLHRIEEFLGIARWGPGHFANHSYGQGVSSPSPRLDETTRQRLDAFFAPHNARLVEEIDPALSWPHPVDTEIE